MVAKVNVGVGSAGSAALTERISPVADAPVAFLKVGTYV